MVSKNQIKLIASLQQKKYRTAEGLFIAEGVKVISELLHSHFQPVFLFQTENVLPPTSMLPELISPEVLKKMSALHEPNNCLAVFKMREPQPFVEEGLILVLDTIRDPGNLGTIIRLCDWFGITQIICSAATVDVYNPKVVQATMGSLSRVSVVYTDIEAFLTQTKLPVFGTFMDGDSVYKQTLPQSAILLLGNEANGISDAVAQHVSQRLSIPRFGDLQQTESLNVATAAAIFLSEFRRAT
ncbi:TrmH family RNA methyltransferase [Flavobacterium sp.]|jgi:TrmH family RNA methyltransferase|uniref:TrmH family RNA methyltransferase n=1 Tax=Flavobacterium sp. TaxID=239 RepID=UPI0022C04F5D|nr:RNA methyltransferase [Flavobacterium sp.]MCZ8143875.1 RNA methyltransferase [Flavobacterium sp.]MCZ8367522.1 RNA methyltransferase [Flavobacterium sp.]